MTILECGLDEAGRGPLAGPVTAGCVILPEDFPFEILNDSKKLSEKKREEAEKIIIERNLMANSNNKSKTADILGIGRKTLQRKLSEWGDDDGDHV